MRFLHRSAAGGRLAVDHLDDFGARFIESPQVVDHVPGFDELPASKSLWCARTKRGSARGVRNCPWCARRSRTSAKNRARNAPNSLTCADSRAELPLVRAHERDFRTAFAELGLVRDHVGRFGVSNIETPPMTGHVPSLDAPPPSRESRRSTTSLGSMSCLHRRPPGARARSEVLRAVCGTALGARARAGLPRRIGPEMRRTPPRARILARNCLTCARTSRVSARRSQNSGWCAPTWRAPMHRLHRSAAGGRPRSWVQCEYPPTWRDSMRLLHRRAVSSRPRG
jgi:hypothetical protein